MISNMAMAEIDSMQKAGLKPTPEDIVRLNALGILIERAPKCGDLYEMPRIAFLGESIAFREPTLAHIRWVENVMEYVNKESVDTFLAVNAFAISRPAETLPDSLDRKACIKEIGKYVKKDLSPFTFDQIKAAVLYALHGNDHVEREFPGGQNDDATLRSIGTGVMMRTIGLGLGISVRDMLKLTKAQAKKLQFLALRACGVDFQKTAVPDAQNDFYVTLDEIKNRLTAERDSENGKQ